MRLPLKEKGKNPHAIILLNKFYENIKDVFENSIRANIFSIDTKVMLADFSVIEVSFILIQQDSNPFSKF